MAVTEPGLVPAAPPAGNRSPPMGPGSAGGEGGRARLPVEESTV